jgi:hypothetical protein
MAARDDSGATISIYTSELAPGDVVTLWWAVFNNPDACNADGCGWDDLYSVEGNPAQGSWGYANGCVIRNHGKAQLLVRLTVGDTSNAIPLPGDAAPLGLLNPREAEIQLWLRTHGPPIPHLVQEQLTTYGGGCSAEAGGTVEGGYACREVQYSVHGRWSGR